MQRIVPGLALFLSLALMTLSPRTARALGVYEDAVGEAGFLFARHATSVGASLHRTEGATRDASIFSVSASFPVRTSVLLQVEQSFAALAGTSEIETGFGDLITRARLRLAGGDDRALSLTGGLRMGTGTKSMYPYSSRSYDMQLGVGYVDSLRVLHLWASAQGVVAKRVPEGLSDEIRHEDFFRLIGGLVVPLADAVHVRAGASTLLFRSGGRRELYFAQVQYAYSPSIEIRVSAHAEAGAQDQRVSDASFTAGIHTYF